MADPITLRIRDTQNIQVTREALTELPESVLLCLFPNGVVLSPPSNRDIDGDGSEEPEETYWVDVRRRVERADRLSSMRNASNSCWPSSIRLEETSTGRTKLRATATTRWDPSTRRCSIVRFVVASSVA